MPHLNEHVQKAEHNEEFVQKIPTSCQDWAVAGTFYAALHYVDAYLSLKNLHPTAHPLRSRFVASIHDLRVIYPDYRILEDVSRDARYHCTPITDSHLTSATQLLQKIKKQILPLLPPATN